MTDSIEKSALRTLISRALALNYTSHSCKDNIATGMHYQTVTLGASVLPGFRSLSSREAVLDTIDLTGCSVLDIGSNLGETSRACARRNAIKVYGIEYDPLFVLIADLINLHEGISPDTVVFEKTDVTNEFKFTDSYDIVLAFSVFTYVGQRLPEIAKATRKALIVETHNIKSENTLAGYVAALSANFPIVVNLGDSDWGEGEQYVGGRRALFACFHDRAEFWSFLLRCQGCGPHLTSLNEIDLPNSDFPTLRQLRADMPSAEMVSGIPDIVPVHEALGIPYPTTQSHLAYWIEFWRGRISAVRDGTITPNNPYVRFMRDLISKGHLFDPGAMKPMRDEATLIARCSARLSSFDSDIPVILFNWSGMATNFRVTSTTGETLICTNSDGNHRLAAKLIMGHKTALAYHFPIYAKPPISPRAVRVESTRQPSLLC